MTSTAKVQVVIYDAPAAPAGGCGCGCGGHDHQGESGSLAGASIEFQTRALALTLEAAFPGKVQVEYINVLQDPRGPRPPPNRTPLFPGLSSAPGLPQRPGPVCGRLARGAHPGRGGEDFGGLTQERENAGGEENGNP